MSIAESKAAEMSKMMEEIPGPSGPNGETFPPPSVVNTIPKEQPEAFETPIKSTTKKSKKTTQPVSHRLSAKITKLLPGAEQVKIYKVDLGKRTYIRSFSIRDLAHADDIETFIQQYLVPKYGEGEYDVEAYNAAGNLARHMSVSVMDPNKPASSPPMDTTLNQILNRVLDKVDRLETHQPSVTDRVVEMARIKELFGSNNGTNGDAMQAMMLMQMLESKNSGGRYSSEISDLRETIRELMSVKNTPAPLPAPLPSDPPVDVAAVLKEAQSSSNNLLAAMLPLLKQDPPPRTSLTDIAAVITGMAPVFKELFGNREADRRMDDMKDTIRELRAELREANNKPTRGISDTLNDIMAVMTVMNKLGPSEPSENFFTLARDVINNLDGLGGLVGEIKQAQAQAQAPQHSQIQAKKPPSRSDKGAADQPQQEPGSPEMQFPPGFIQRIQKIESAKDDGDRIRGTLEAIYLMSKSETWAPWVVSLRDLITQGMRDDALDSLSQFFEAMVEARLMTEEPAKAAMSAFELHYEKVAQFIVDSTKEAESGETSEEAPEEDEGGDQEDQE